MGLSALPFVLCLLPAPIFATFLRFFEATEVFTGAAAPLEKTWPHAAFLHARWLLLPASVPHFTQCLYDLP